MGGWLEEGGLVLSRKVTCLLRKSDLLSDFA